MVWMVVAAAVQAAMIVVGVVAFYGLKRQEQERLREGRSPAPDPAAS